MTNEIKRLNRIVAEQQLTIEQLRTVNQNQRDNLDFIMERKPIYKLFF